MAYRIEVIAEAGEHLAALTARDRAAVLDHIARQLQYEPTRATRSRKRMRANPIAPWVLRVGRLRVYYDVSTSPEPIVSIRAIGVKERNRVRIGGEEVDLS